jgi:hypothetical protein
LDLQVQLGRLHLTQLSIQAYRFRHYLTCTRHFLSKVCPSFSLHLRWVCFCRYPRAYVNLNRDQTYSTGGYNLTPINHGLTLPGDRFGLEASTTSYDGTTIEMDCDFTRNDIAIRTETISLVEVDGGSNDPSFDFCLTQYGVLGTGYSDNWAFEIDNGCS